MLLKCRCPGCGEEKEYIAEQVGTPLDCFHCGRRFVLKSNRVRSTWKIISAAVAVLVFAGALVTWYYEARRWESADVHITDDESYLFGGHPDSK